VASINLFEKYWSKWIISPGRGKNEQYLKPRPGPRRGFSSNKFPPKKISLAHRHLSNSIQSPGRKV